MNARLFAFALLSVLGLREVDAQTGDSIIDSWIAGYSQKAGNSATPNNLSLSNYSSFNACSSPSAPAWEDNCPSDLTYAPIQSTGGYQAFGVGVTNHPEEFYWWPVCYYEEAWVWDDNLDQWVLEYQYWCYWYYTYSPPSSNGRAAGRIAWSPTTVGTLMGSRAIGTVALKSNLDHPPGFTDWECEPSRVWGAGDSAPCAPWKDNAYIVPRGYSVGVGYEDKVVITESSCNVFLRADSPSDAENGCFTTSADNWWSNLPAPYKDTTLGDPASSFRVAVGSASPAAIQEGYTYSWYVDFWAMGNENLLGTTAEHRAGITIHDSGLPCNGSPALCQFTVDQTKIAEAPFHP